MILFSVFLDYRHVIHRVSTLLFPVNVNFIVCKEFASLSSPLGTSPHPDLPLQEVYIPS